MKMGMCTCVAWEMACPPIAQAWRKVWLRHCWLDSLITPVSTPNNPEYELCLPPFRVVRPGLIRLVLDVHGLSVSVLKDCYKL